MTEKKIAKIVVDAAVSVHRDPGPGLVETAYEVVFAHVLRQRGMALEHQVPVPIEYRGIMFDEAFRADTIVEIQLVDGHIAGSANTIPGPGEPSGNHHGHVIPARLSFLMAKTFL